jgi:hypothetical protein
MPAKGHSRRRRAGRGSSAHVRTTPKPAVSSRPWRAAPDNRNIPKTSPDRPQARSLATALPEGALARGLACPTALSTPDGVGIPLKTHHPRGSKLHAHRGGQFWTPIDTIPQQPSSNRGRSIKPPCAETSPRRTGFRRQNLAARARARSRPIARSLGWLPACGRGIFLRCNNVSSAHYDKARRNGRAAAPQARAISVPPHRMPAWKASATWRCRSGSRNCDARSSRQEDAQATSN